MKKHIWLTILALMLIVFGSFVTVQAEVLAPYGEGQIGLQAVVLCDSLTVREQPSVNTRAVRILHSEDRIIVTKQEDGWAQICISDAVDAGPEGWVKTDYIVIDPAWYRADSATPVYAWNDIVHIPQEWVPLKDPPAAAGGSFLFLFDCRPVFWYDRVNHWRTFSLWKYTDMENTPCGSLWIWMIPLNAC